MSAIESRNNKFWALDLDTFLSFLWFMHDCMSEYKYLALEEQDDIAIVRVNKPDVLNILDTPTVLEIEDCFSSLDRDDAGKVIIITGAGEKAFIAGGDIKEVSIKNNVEGRE